MTNDIILHYTMIMLIAVLRIIAGFAAIMTIITAGYLLSGHKWKVDEFLEELWHPPIFWLLIIIALLIGFIGNTGVEWRIPFLIAATGITMMYLDMPESLHMQIRRGTQGNKNKHHLKKSEKYYREKFTYNPPIWGAIVYCFFQERDGEESVRGWFFIVRAIFFVVWRLTIWYVIGLIITKLWG